jgi:Ca2+-binding RTX toxin-like protein
VSEENVSRGFGSHIVHFTGTESLTLNATNFDDRAFVFGTAPNTSVTLRMGNGNDRVDIHGTNSTLAAFGGPVTVDGQAGVDRLEIFDQGTFTQILDANGVLVPVDYTITASVVSRTLATPITYAGIDDLEINVAAASGIIFFNPLATGGNDVLMKGTSAATTINIGTYGAYTVTLGSDAGSMDPVQQPVIVNDEGSLVAMVLNDQGDSTANSYTLTHSGVTRNGSALLSWNLPHTSTVHPILTLYAGVSNDTATVESTLGHGMLPVRLRMGAGNDTVIVGHRHVFAHAPSSLSMDGAAGADALIVNADNGDPASPYAGSFTIAAANVKRYAQKILAYDAMESLTFNAGGGADVLTVTTTKAETPVFVNGGGGDDVFKVEGFDAPGLAGPVTFDGQGGTDTLDYSAHSSAVRVNLALGTATGVAGGVSGIENATGGLGDDILVGNDLASVLRGGDGRDILIGRGGADQLFGEAGDDILIGDSTAHDLSPARLEDLMAEWGRNHFGYPVTKYNTRVNNLLGVTSGGLNGTTLLNLSQVSGDGVADLLEGGSELDWFFALAADSILGLDQHERING